MDYKITQTKLTGEKKFVIAPDRTEYSAGGQIIPVKGFTLVLEQVGKTPLYETIVTEAKDNEIKEKFGIGIIDRLKDTNSYKGNFLTIKEAKEPKKRGRKTK